MRLTTKGRYGMRLVLDIAQHEKYGPVSMAETSLRQDISAKYLERLVGELQRAGIVSLRGREGGHLLAVPPEQITVGAIVRVLEGESAQLTCSHNRLSCPRSVHCPHPLHLGRGGPGHVREARLRHGQGHHGRRAELHFQEGTGAGTRQGRARPGAGPQRTQESRAPHFAPAPGPGRSRPPAEARGRAEENHGGGRRPGHRRLSRHGVPRARLRHMQRRRRR